MSYRTAIPKCVKTAYADERTANLIVKRRQRYNNDKRRKHDTNTNVQFCKLCDAWHITK